jgi:hypothetical protein
MNSAKWASRSTLAPKNCLAARAVIGLPDRHCLGWRQEDSEQEHHRVVDRHVPHGFVIQSSQNRNSRAIQAKIDARADVLAAIARKLNIENHDYLLTRLVGLEDALAREIGSEQAKVRAQRRPDRAPQHPVTVMSLYWRQFSTSVLKRRRSSPSSCPTEPPPRCVGPPAGTGFTHWLGHLIEQVLQRFMVPFDTGAAGVIGLEGADPDLLVEISVEEARDAARAVGTDTRLALHGQSSCVMRW